ncbi:MAG: (Fe-S)-binding protein [Candidatus Hydrothermarchaeales archaeon]
MGSNAKIEFKSISPLDVYKHLPKDNCGECGIQTCMGFAVRLLRREAYLENCPRLKDAKYISAKLALKELLAQVLEAKETRLVIYGDLCNGCGNCVIVCPPNASCSLEASGGKGPLSEEVVMDIGDGVVVEVNIDACRRAGEDVESEPCRLCIDVCPFKAIEFL